MDDTSRVPNLRDLTSDVESDDKRTLPQNKDKQTNDCIFQHLNTLSSFI